MGLGRYIENFGASGVFRDLIEMKLAVWDGESLGAKFELKDIPEDILDEANAARDNMLELLSDNNESIMEDYLEGKEISRDTIIDAVRVQTIDLNIVPVLCGSAFKNKGVQLLLDAVVRYLPSPLSSTDKSVDLVLTFEPTLTGVKNLTLSSP